MDDQPSSITDTGMIARVNPFYMVSIFFKGDLVTMFVEIV
ncbi:hypothetical protein MY3296_002821 [Beauveria thailandica]